MKQVLIVDDNPEARLQLQSVLERNGYSVVTAVQGEDALAKARQQSPVLVMSDLLMPVLDGYSLLRQWRADPELRSIPFIVYSGTYTDPRDQRLAMELGANAFLPKPAPPERVLACIEDVLSAGEQAGAKQSSQFEETVFLNRYSEALVRKLSKKAQELRKTNRELLDEISDRMRTESALRESEGRYRMLFHAITDPLFVYDRETLQYLDVNDSAVRLYGYSREEFLSMKLVDIRPEEDVEPLLAMLAEMPTTLESRGVWRHRKKNGEVIEVEITAFGLDYGGRPACFVQARDVTQQRRAEAERARTMTLLQAVADGATDAVFVKDRDGKYLLFNQAAARVAGKPVEEVLGRDDREVFGPANARLLMEHDRQVMEANAPQTVEELMETRDGPRVFHAMKAPYRDADGRVLGVVGVSRDITAERAAEAARQESEQRFRQLAESIEEVFWLTEPRRSRFLYVSPSYKRIWGLDGSGLFEDPDQWLEAIHEEDRERVRETLLKLPVGTFNAEYRVLRPDGTVRWVSDRAFPIRNEQGEVYRVAGVAQDITSRKEAEAAERASQERFQLLAKATNDAIWDWDLETNSLWWGYGIESLFGVRRTELGPTIESWYSRIHPDDADRVMQSVHETIARGDESWSQEYRYRRGDGSYAYVLDRGHLLRRADGKPVRMVGGLADMTERVRSEMELRMRDRAIQEVSQGILITDPNRSDNPIVFAGAGFQRMTGYEAEEVLGRNCRFLQGKNTDPETVRQLRTAVFEGRGCSVEILNYRKDGSPFWNHLVISPVPGPDGKLLQFVGVITDITERRKLEEQFRQAQKMEAVGQLAGGVAHDFNNLLTVINGYSDLLSSQLGADDSRRELVGEIRQAGERARNLTRQLLAFSRQQMLQPTALDLNQVVASTENMLRRLIGEDIQFETALQPDLPLVMADRGQIEQSLMNLVINARDAMSHGGRLTIATGSVHSRDLTSAEDDEPTPGEYVSLSVIDTGCGMDAATKARIFEPFFTTKPGGKGTGLGLPMVHGIVKQSRGQIAVHSQPGEGTEFVIYLPRLSAGVQEEERVATSDELPRGSETILLAEDEPPVRALGKLVLEECGYRVLEAVDGNEALQLALQAGAPIDLLVSDVVMPQLGGRSLAEQFMAVHPESRVLFLSGYTDDEVIRHGVLEAEFEFLQKPFTPATLAQKVREVLDSARRHD